MTLTRRELLETAAASAVLLTVPSSSAPEPVAVSIQEARARGIKAWKTDGIDALLAKHKLVALVMPTMDAAYMTDIVHGDAVAPGSMSSSPAAVSGCPSISLPMGFVRGTLPVGISFVGAAWDDARLISLAYAFEQLTKARRPPQLLATVPA